MLKDLIALDFNSLFENHSTSVIICLVIIAILSLYTIICHFRMFKKAGVNPWFSIIPIYSTVKLLKIANLKLSYLILLFIPVANIYALIKMKYEISLRFGGGVYMTLLYFFVPVIPLFIYAFKSEYVDIASKEQEIIMKDFTPEFSDNLANFVPVQSEGAVPYEEGVVAYTNSAPVLSDDEIEKINQTFAQLNAEKEAQEALEKAKIAQEEEAKAQKVAKQTSFFAAVPLEEKPESYEKPRQEKVKVVPKAFMPTTTETIVTPTGTNPDGIDVQTAPKKEVVQPQEKTCPICGMKLEPGANVCFMCGTKL